MATWSQRNWLDTNRAGFMNAPTHIIMVHVLADSARGYNFNGTSFPVLEHFPAEELD